MIQLTRRQWTQLVLDCTDKLDRKKRPLRVGSDGWVLIGVLIAAMADHEEAEADSSTSPEAHMYRLGLRRFTLRLARELGVTIPAQEAHHEQR